MLFSLSLKNIRKSIRDYVIYFFTLIAGVAIFYVFNAIESQTVMLAVSERTYEIIKLMLEMLSGVSVIVSMILAFLIIYASRFMMKRRNKEFGVYLTLGMGKRKISMVLFFETLMIGILSLAVGLILGICLSQLMSVFVANMFEADMTRFTFVFSEPACKKTMLYFGMMYLIVMLFNTVSVSRCRLIDLLHSEKRSEQVKMKNPLLCILVFIAAVMMLAKAYSIVTGNSSVALSEPTDILFPIGLGIAGTFLVFWSGSGLLLRFFMCSKKLYYRELNCFTLRQVSSQINTAVGTVSVICLMLFITICVLTAGFSVKNSLDMQLDEFAPLDIEIVKGMEDGVGIARFYDEAGMDICGKLSEWVNVAVYESGDFTVKDFLGDEFERLKNRYTFIGYETCESIIGLSDYNRLAKLFGMETYTLSEDEYLIVANFQSMIAIRNMALQQGQRIHVFGRTLQPKYNACRDGQMELGASHTNTGFFVVPDSVTEGAVVSKEHLLGNYKAAGKEDKMRLEEEIMRLSQTDGAGTGSRPAINTRLDILESAIGLGAMVAFLGMYLGVVFLISSAAILALKQLSESADNRERYRRLRQLGVDERQLRKALLIQIAIFFLAPLLLAVVHAVFGLRFSMILLEAVGTAGLVRSTWITALILLLLYGGYFLLTYWCSKQVIRET